MAQLRNLGMPFGSPSGIINIPAPAGAALAGQIQMQQLERLGQSLGLGLGRREQGRLEQEDLRRMLSMPQTQDIYGTMYGARGMPVPQAQMPQMQSRKFQEMQTAGLMGQMFADPLEREYLRERIGATRALTKEREAGAKQALPDRMLRQADRYLRVVDDIMSEYWYTPEGPYRDKLLKDAQNAREKAIKLIDKYGPTSEAGKASLQQLANLDEQIKKAGGKVSPPKPKRVYAKPNKAQFMTTYRNLKTPEEKQRFINKYWRPEFGRYLE